MFVGCLRASIVQIIYPALGMKIDLLPRGHLLAY